MLVPHHVGPPIHFDTGAFGFHDGSLSNAFSVIAASFIVRFRACSASIFFSWACCWFWRACCTFAPALTLDLPAAFSPSPALSREESQVQSRNKHKCVQWPNRCKIVLSGKFVLYCNKTFFGINIKQAKMRVVLHVSIDVPLPVGQVVAAFVVGAQHGIGIRAARVR